VTTGVIDRFPQVAKAVSGLSRGGYYDAYVRREYRVFSDFLELDRLGFVRSLMLLSFHRWLLSAVCKKTSIPPAVFPYYPTPPPL
jgi:hypothetical protein